MRRTLVILVIALLAVSIVGLVLFYSESNYGGSMGHGAQSGQMMQSQDDRSLWLLLFAIPLVIALVAVTYEALFPKIKATEKTVSPEQIQVPEETHSAEVPTDKSQKLDAILRVLNVDERKVVEVLASSADGTLLQRDIKWKAGLSRVKTHRVLARLSARGIVNVEKYYNTNKVTLANWIARNEKTEDPH